MAHPAAAGFSQPAEWSAQAGVWMAWPGDASLWEDALPVAQAEVEVLVRAIVAPGPDGSQEPVDLLVADPAQVAAVQARFAGLPVTVHAVPFGDIWMRDIAPVFLTHADGRVGSVRFAFNGWGGKYVLDHDADVAEAVQRLDGRQAFVSEVVLEGGSVDVDGEGTVLTTRQCLLHPNRNGATTEAQMAAHLRDLLGVRTVLWLGDGLLNDHTDGHVDTIARFVAPGHVVCMAPSGDDDPNAGVLHQMAQDLSQMTDAQGRRLVVHRIPSPGRVLDGEGRIMPASHVNFLIANHVVVVPTYGTPYDTAAVEALTPLFPGRRVVGASARAILEGGGAFHCITQQVPAGGLS